MKTLIILATILVGSPISNLSQATAPQPVKKSPEVEKVLKQVVKNHPKLQKQYATTLAQTIVKKSKKYGISPKILAAILMQESSYKLDAKGIRCGVSLTTGEKDCVAVDFGIGQINYKNVKNFKFDQKKLMSDMTYSVEAAAIILSDYKRFQRKEPTTWYCRYNVGTGGLDRIKPACQKYVILVARHM